MAEAILHHNLDMVVQGRLCQAMPQAPTPCQAEVEDMRLPLQGPQAH